MSLQKAKQNGWLLCSCVFNNSAHSVEVGEMFPVDRVLFEVLHISVGHEATVRHIDNGVFSTMNVADIVFYMNESSLS
jgi:hypothetical protein